MSKPIDIQDHVYEHIRDVYIRSSDKNRNFIIAFILLEIFIFIAVANTSDIHFLIPDKKISLPLLNVTVSIFGFYIISPILIFGLHLTLLFNISQHAVKVKHWNDLIHARNLEKIKNTLLSHFFFNYQYADLSPPMRIWLNFINYVTIVASAPLLLFYMWIRFWDYHQFWYSLLHFIILLLDCFILHCYYWHQIFIYQKQTQRHTIRSPRKWYSNIKTFFQYFTKKTKALCSSQHIFKYILFISCGLFLIQAYFIFADIDKDKESLQYKIFNRFTDYMPHLKIQNCDLVLKGPSDIIARHYLDRNKAKCERLNHYSGVTLDNRNLRYANFNASNLFNGSLKNAKLEFACLTNTKWHGANIENAQLHFSQLDNSIIDHVKMSGINLYSSHMENTVIRNSVGENPFFSNAIFINGKIINSRLTNATFRNSNMAYVVINNTDLVDSHFNQVNLSSAFINNVNFSHATLIRSEMIDSSLSKVNMSGVRMTACNLGNASITDCTFDKVYFTNTLMKSTTFKGGSIKNASFSYTQAYESSSDFAKQSETNPFIESAVFLGVELSNADFNDIIIKESDFRGSNLSKLRSHNTSFVNCNFNGAIITKNLLEMINNEDCVLVDSDTYMNCSPDNFFNIRNQLSCESTAIASGILKQYRDPILKVKYFSSETENALKAYMENQCPEIAKSVWENQ